VVLTSRNVTYHDSRESVYPDMHSISVTIVCIALKSRIWHIQYKCIYIYKYKWYFDPLPMVVWPLSMVFWPHYPWYFEPLPMVFWPPTYGISSSLPMVYSHPIHGILTPIYGILTPYAWYIDLLTHDISDPLPMVAWPLYTWYFNPYAWYFDPLPIVYRSLNHDILTLLYTIFWPLYPWYIEPLPMVFWPLCMIFWPLYSWYNESPTHGISTPYQWYVDPPMHSIWPPYSWYIETPTHGISTLHSLYFDLPFMVIWPSNHDILTPLYIIFLPLSNYLTHWATWIRIANETF
jgi:hypothetical protein